MTGLVEIQERQGITVVTMQRPPANALDQALLAEGLQAADSLRGQAPAAIVITGSGRFFSGGADLRVLPTLGPAEQVQLMADVNELFVRWHGLPMPVVAAVNGHAIAGGLILALCADYRVVGRSGQFGLTEVKVGVPYPVAALGVVQAELAPAAARRLVLRAELVDAETAVQLGVFDELTEDDRLLDRAIAVAGELAALPRATFSAAKADLRGRAVDLADDRRQGFHVTGEAAAAARRVLGGADGT